MWLEVQIYKIGCLFDVGLIIPIFTLIIERQRARISFDFSNFHESAEKKYSGLNGRLQ